MRTILILFFLFLSKIPLLAQQPICGTRLLTKYVKYQLLETGYRNLEINGIRYFKKGYWVSGFIEKMDNGNRDFFVAKLNDTGGVEFTKVMGDLAQEGGYCSALPVSDGCLISGRSKGVKDVAIISKITNTGSIAWTKTTEENSGSYDAFRGVHMDEAKSQILAVGTGMQKTGTPNVMVVSLDKSGNTLWTRNIDLGGSQHNLNAIQKVDSIYYVAGWAMFSGVWRPTMMRISETGRLIKGQYSDVSENAIYVDMEVSPTGKIYLLGFALVMGRQYACLTSMSPNGNVLWRKYLGYGNNDFGDNLFFDGGSLWVFGQTTVSGVGKREFFVKYDTLGAVQDRGGLYESPYAFSAKINGWPVGRSHFGGIAVVGIDSKTANSTHFEIMFTNPCDKLGCSVNAASGLISNDYSISEKNLSLPSKNATNGGMVDVALSSTSLNLQENYSCYRNCSFTSIRKLPLSLSICNGGGIATTDVRNANYKYLWDNGDTAAKHTFTKPGLYWVKTYNDCGTRIDTIVISQIDSPTKTRLADSLYCYKGWVYQVNFTSIPQTTIAWENGDASWNRNITLPGKYWYEVKNDCGTWRDTFLLLADSLPKSILPSKINGCNGQSIFLDGTQPGKGKYQYQWEDGFTGGSVWATNTVTKILKTWNICGSVVDTVKIVFDECNCYFYIPDAFTPSWSRGKNDGWKPEFNCPMDGVSYSIYSRWGECLVKNQPISVPWDGYYMGDLVTEGVYVYLISGSYQDPKKGGRWVQKSGTLTILDGGK